MFGNVLDIEEVMFSKACNCELCQKATATSNLQGSTPTNLFLHLCQKHLVQYKEPVKLRKAPAFSNTTRRSQFVFKNARRMTKIFWWN